MRWEFMKRNILVSCLAILIGSACAWAQTGTTSVRGTVMDKSGAAISGAHITVANTAQAVERETNTNASGEYEVLALPPGTYAVTVSADGFRKYEMASLHLLVNNPATLNVTLEIGTTVQTVEVSAQSQH